MQTRKPRKAGRMVAGRTARFLLAAMLCQPASLISVQSANALEIFGWKIFGSDDENEDVVDPLNYTVTLESAAQIFRKPLV